MRWDLIGTLIAGIVLGTLVVGHSLSQTPGGWQLRACASAICAWRLQTSTGHLELCLNNNSLGFAGLASSDSNPPRAQQGASLDLRSRNSDAGRTRFAPPAIRSTRNARCEAMAEFVFEPMEVARCVSIPRLGWGKFTPVPRSSAGSSALAFRFPPRRKKAMPPPLRC